MTETYGIPQDPSKITRPDKGDAKDFSTTTYRRPQTVEQIRASYYAREIGKLNTEISKVNSEIVELNKQKAIADENLRNANPLLPGYDAALQAVNQLNSQIVAKQTQRNNLLEQKKRFTDLQKPKTKTTGKVTQAATPPSTTPKPYQGGFKYNAPMVSTAYLKSPSIQQEMSGAPLYPANYANIESLWQQSRSAKGTIQPSKLTVANIRNSAKEKNISLKDKNVYGFRFHYNPTTIAMGWGLNMDASPEYIMGQGTQTAIPIALGSNTASNISMEIVLNRTHDLAYIDSNGNVSGNPYPHSKPNSEDAKMIYNRGTMYDIEYLFRTIFGQDAVFNSAYNGLTADKGLMWMVPLQVSLGKGLNYLVRIRDLSLNHVMFNQRMVPIFTTVSLRLERFYDGPNAFDSSDGPTTRSRDNAGGSGGTLGGGVAFQ